MNTIYDFKMKKIDGKDTSLEEFKGKVTLIVNVASKCGLTPQYEGLTKLYKQYKDKGLEILGFPANEFLGQEPGTDEEIQQFCTLNYNVDFPIFQKIVVKGEGQHPLYNFLTQNKPDAVQKEGGKLLKILEEKGLLSGMPNDIKWNFEKFLINRHGEIVERFSPDVEPNDPVVIAALERELAAR